MELALVVKGMLDNGLGIHFHHWDVWKIDKARTNEENVTQYRACIGCDLKQYQSSPTGTSHIHEWKSWDDGSVTNIYDSEDDQNDKLPIRRDLVQRRSCIGCNKIEVRKTII